MLSENFRNPLAFPSITNFLAAVLEVVIIMAVPIIAFFLIYSGFMYVTARGNAEKITLSHRSLTYGVIGGVIILGAVAILGIVKNTIEAF